MKNRSYENAVSAIKERRFNDALDILDDLLQNEPSNPIFISERGVVHFHMGDKQKSLKDMDFAIELDVNNPYRYSSRAYIKGHYRMFEEAISDYQKAIELDPDDAIALNNLGLIQEQMGYHSKALENFKKADALQGIKSKLGNTDQGIEGKELYPRNIQREINDENDTKSLGSILKTLFSKKGFNSYLRFISSGFKET